MAHFNPEWWLTLVRNEWLSLVRNIHKELLGHSKIETTMVYLHIAKCSLVRAHSPLDTLYAQQR